jgi:hypothetical protein
MVASERRDADRGRDMPGRTVQLAFSIALVLLAQGPAHLSTLRLAASRQRLSLAEVRLISDPDVIDPGISMGLIVTATPGTGTLSTGAPAMPVRGLLGLRMLTGAEAQGRAGAASGPDASSTWVTVNGATAGVGGRYYSQTTGTYLTRVITYVHTAGSSTFPAAATLPAYWIRQLSVQGTPRPPPPRTRRRSVACSRW